MTKNKINIGPKLPKKYKSLVIILLVLNILYFLGDADFLFGLIIINIAIIALYLLFFLIAKQFKTRDPRDNNGF